MSEFVPASRSFESELQNAVARLGARHLVETDDIVPSERFREAHAVVREVLADARSPRMIAGLAPVLVEHSDSINLAKLALELNQVGLERRLYWLAENVQEALRRALRDKPPAARARKLLRAQLALGQFLATAPRHRKPAEVDLLDPNVRSDQTVRELKATASRISKRWSVATAIQVDDFCDALGQADQLARKSG